MRDVREAVRALRSTPLVTAAAVVTLALGIGANAAIFSILDSLLLRSLPIRDPHGLVAVAGEAPGEDAELMYPAWLAVRDAHLLDGTFAWAKDGLSEVQGGETRPVIGIWASDHDYDTLAVRAQLGRTFDRSDDAVAVISASFWRRRFAGAPDAVGRTVLLDRVPFTVVGITEPPFFGLDVGTTFDVVLPLESEPLLRRVPSRRALWPWLHVAGRLPAGHTIESAAAALRSAQPGIRTATNPFEDLENRQAYLKEPWTLRSAGNGTSRLRGRYGSALTILMIIAALVLLIGCANIANLELARAQARRYERSVRAALGASRWRLMLPVLLESVMLAAAGTALGLAVAQPTAALIVAQLATWAAAPVLDLALDARVLGVSAGLMTTAVLLFGVVPAIVAGYAAPLDAIKRLPSRTRIAGTRTGEALIGVQIAVCVLLLVGAALFIRSFAALVDRDLGFDRGPVVVAAVDARRSHVAAPRRLAMFERMRDEAARLPGVERAALSMATPLGNAGVRFTPRVALDAAAVRSDSAPRVLTNLVSPGWFAAYGTRFRGGRDFSARDTASATPAAIVNDAFARRFFAGVSPLGRTFSTTTPREGPVTVEIVGVVEDAAFTSVRNPVEPTMYRPLAQAADDTFFETMPVICVSVRAASTMSPERLREAVAPALAAVDRDSAVSTVTVGAQLDAYYVRERLLGLLTGLFAVIGLLLAAIGLYGVTSLSVNGRRHELAVRVAVGADGRRIGRLVFRRLAVVIACGALIGGAVAVAAGRIVESLLFGVSARDPLAFGAAFVTLLVTAIAAAAGPVRRAARTEPMMALREP